jgi:hypothetical protein
MQGKTPAPQVAGPKGIDPARGSCKLMEEESSRISELKWSLNGIFVLLLRQAVFRAKV